MDANKTQKSKKPKNLGRILVLILLGLLTVTLLLSGIVIYFYLSQIGCWPIDAVGCQLDNINSFALMGDYLSGAQGPVFDFAAFFAVLVALVIQQRQLAAQREESARSLTIQIETARKKEIAGLIERVYVELVALCDIDDAPKITGLIEEVELLLKEYAGLPDGQELCVYYRKRLLALSCQSSGE